MHPFGRFKAEDIQNELRAVSKLCGSLTHRNIVPVLRQGTMPPNYYFIDMELCELSLKTYLLRRWTPSLEKDVPFFANESLPQWMRVRHLWGIMEDIASGVAFIHSHEEVHRDLKPPNSNFRQI